MRVSEAALMKAASKNIIRGGGLDELFEGTASKRARREKIGDEEALERKTIETNSSVRSLFLLFWLD